MVQSAKGTPKHLMTGSVDPSGEFAAATKDWERETSDPDRESIRKLTTHHGHDLGFWLLAINIRYKANIGGMIRVASNFGASGLAMVGLKHYRRAPSLGLASSVPLLHFPAPEEAVAWFQSEGITLVAAERTEASVPIQHATWPLNNVCFVIGDERSGVPAPLLEASQLVVDIPMYGQSASLNLAVCAAVLSFEHVRRLGFPDRCALNPSGRTSGWHPRSGPSNR